MIQLSRVWKHYGDTVALCDVSLSVEKGEVALLTGPSGAGKSTLLRLLYAAERADRGQVTVAGRDLARLRRESIPYLRRNLGVIFQDFKLLRDRTAAENVEVALQILDVPYRQVKLRAAAALDAVGLGQKAAVRAGKLSGGEQQRVAIARALVGEPPILLCDEPTGNLDPIRALDLLALFERLRGHGVTMVLATHDPDVVRFGATSGWRRVRLEAGALVDAAPEAILECDPTDQLDRPMLTLVPA